MNLFSSLHLSAFLHDNSAFSTGTWEAIFAIISSLALDEEIKTSEIECAWFLDSGSLEIT
mgnify:CR=1 FL=1